MALVKVHMGKVADILAAIASKEVTTNRPGYSFH